MFLILLAIAAVVTAGLSALLCKRSLLRGRRPSVGLGILASLLTSLTIVGGIVLFDVGWGVFSWEFWTGDKGTTYRWVLTGLGFAFIGCLPVASIVVSRYQNKIGPDPDSSNHAIEGNGYGRLR